MRYKKNIIRVAVIVALFASAYYGDAWLAILLAAGVFSWCLWSELWNQLRRMK